MEHIYQRIIESLTDEEMIDFTTLLLSNLAKRKSHYELFLRSYEPLNEHEKMLLDSDQVLKAIKQYRSRTKYTLATAKDAIDFFRQVEEFRVQTLTMAKSLIDRCR